LSQLTIAERIQFIINSISMVQNSATFIAQPVSRNQRNDNG
jgi:hypothetical protein